jgi:hypothetical protein
MAIAPNAAMTLPRPPPTDAPSGRCHAPHPAASRRRAPERQRPTPGRDEGLHVVGHLALLANPAGAALPRGTGPAASAAIGRVRLEVDTTARLVAANRARHAGRAAVARAVEGGPTPIALLTGLAFGTTADTVAVAVAGGAGAIATVCVAGAAAGAALASAKPLRNAAIAAATAAGGAQRVQAVLAAVGRAGVAVEVARVAAAHGARSGLTGSRGIGGQRTRATARLGAPGLRVVVPGAARAA